MAVSWYEASIYKMVSPDGSKTTWNTKLTSQWVLETWTATDETGTTTQVPQNIHRKYDGVLMSVVYNEPPTDENHSNNVALVRVEYPDGGIDPVVANTSDYLINFTTQAQWDAQIAIYPNLKERFVNQPYYPTTV